ncbi:MarR family winged helix-turn-helix transcriptional regulator [Streptomyces coffeae]|uniref:MarR family transcriptional regulator n=1 Tax=Streptomyces coffeae TaxID=621382 RepID=A0ABS1NEN3_9ACTN|nr:MarR family transcriptional regulator [Streptomyces coffeae]MBL1098384.1 MarR family transcriptional regulator [Streptomyces coffeae]
MRVQPLDDTPMHLLRRALQRATAAWQTEVPELTAPQYATLSVLAEHPGIDQSALAQATAIDRSTMTALLDRLSSRGWLVRETDPANRRRHIVRITPEGRALLDDLEPAVRRVNQWTFDQIDKERVPALLPLLRDLAGIKP